MVTKTGPNDARRVIRAHIMMYVPFYLFISSNLCFVLNIGFTTSILWKNPGNKQRQRVRDVDASRALGMFFLKIVTLLY